MTEKPSFSPLIVLSIGILAVSNGAIFVRKALAYAPSITVAAYRLGLAALFLTPFVFISHKKEVSQLDWKTRGMAFLSGAFLALHFVTWITSLQYTTIASSVTLVATTPLWVAVLNPFTVKEKISRQLFLGMLLAVLGSVIVGLSDQCTWNRWMLICPSLSTFFAGRAILGDCLALLGAIMAAGYLLAGRKLRPRLSLTAYIFLSYGIAALVLLTWNWFRRIPLLNYPKEAYGWFLALAIVPQLIGHTSFNWALRYLPTAFVSIALLGEPIGTTILAFFLFNEVPNIFKLGGIALILMGLLITSLQLQLK